MSLRDIVKVLIVSAVSLVVFGVYLVFIGIPRTQARNLYNEAYTLSTQDKQLEAKAKFAEAYRVWPEPYILNALQRLEHAD